MKIVQLITRPQRRGAEIFAVQLAEELLKLGHQVWVISIFKGDGGLSFSGGILELGLESGRKLDIKGFQKLAKKLREIEPDILQANASDTLRYAVASKYFYKKPFKLIYRNANTISSFIRGKGQLMYNKLLHSHVDGVISVSNHSLLDYQMLFSPKHIQTIPIGIDVLEIEGKLQAGNFAFEKEYLLFMGSLVPEKDPLGMLDIFKIVLKKHENLHLIFLGSGLLEQMLINRIEQLGLKDSVLLLSNQENIFPILSKAKALVMPSKIEGLPGVILEAMYCKVPVVAYGVGGIPEIVISDKTGWLVDPEDAKGFASAIGDVLHASSNEIEKMTIFAKDLVLKKYQIDQIADEFDDFLLQSIISNTD